MDAKETPDKLLDEAIAKAYAGGAPASFRAAIERAARTSDKAADEPLAARVVPLPAKRPTWLLPLVAALLGAMLVLTTTMLMVRPQEGGPIASSAGDSSLMVREAVNDHLRVLYSEHPVEIASGGIHQVKPWFAGKLDFAPTNPFSGDADFPLEGGAVSVFMDRKAATYVYKRNLHVVTLFVFPAQGLTFPETTKDVSSVRATVQTTRGFHLLLWHKDDLGYALVSDLNEQELTMLAVKIVN